MKKKKKFLSFKRTGGIKIEITIKDEDWRVIDTFKTNIKDFPKIVGIMKRQYGIDFKPEIPKPLKSDKDLDWRNTSKNPF